jgi:hypothetical protein
MVVRLVSRLDHYTAVAIALLLGAGLVWFWRRQDVRRRLM